MMLEVADKNSDLEGCGYFSFISLHSYLRNNSNNLSDCMALHPRRQQSSACSVFEKKNRLQCMFSETLHIYFPLFIHIGR
jgi:hypothetical protein